MQLACEILAWLPFDRFQEAVANLRWDVQGAISVRSQLRDGKTALGPGEPWYRYARLCTFQGELTKWSERPAGRQFLMCRAVFLGKNAYALRLLRELTWEALSMPVVDFLLRSGDEKFLKDCPPEILVRLSLPDVQRLPRAWRRLYRYLGQSKWWQLKDKNTRVYYSASINEPSDRPTSCAVGMDGSSELEKYLSSRSPEGQVKWLLKRIYPELLRSRLASCLEVPTVDLLGRIFTGKICLSPDLAERARALLALLPASESLYTQTLRILAGEPVAEHWLLEPSLKVLLLAVAHPQVQSETFQDPHPLFPTINRGGLFHDVVNYFRVFTWSPKSIPGDLLLELFARGQAWQLLEHPNWSLLTELLAKE